MLATQMLRRPVMGCVCLYRNMKIREIGDNVMFAHRAAKTQYALRLFASQSSQHQRTNSDQEKYEAKEKLVDKIRKSQTKFKIISLPNFITSSRALVAPAIGYFIINNMHSYALACCAYAIVSDVLDKAVANLTNQASPLNRTLDALADKLLILTSFIALYKLDFVSIYLLKSVIIRDFIIVVGGAAVRYNGFEKRPTIKQFLDINNYPTLAFKVTALNRVVIGVQYSIIMTHLGLHHLTGNPTYDWAVFIWHGVALGASSLSLGSYITHFMQPRFLSKLPGW